MKFSIACKFGGLILIALVSYRSVDAELCTCPFIYKCIFKNMSIVKDAELFCSVSVNNIDDFSITDYNETSIMTGIFDTYSHLRALEFWHGSIQHIKPGAFEKLSNLKILGIRRNNISILENYTFRGLGALEKLDLYSNNITSIAPHAFYGLQSLSRLTLSGNKLTELPANIFSSTPKLKSILLSYNLLTYLPEGIFDNIDFLLRLDLTNNRLQTFIFPDLKGMLWLLSNNLLTSLYINDHVKVVQANHNQILTIDGTGRNLTELRLNSNAISDVTPITRMTNLVHLILNNNPLQANSIFASLAYLQTLLISNTSIRVRENTFRNLSSLVLLDLSNNNLTQLDFRMFSSMVDLETLIVAQNHIQLINFTELRLYLPELRILEICDNGWNATYMEHMLLHMKHHKLSRYWEVLPKAPVFLSFFVDLCSDISGKFSVEYSDYTYSDDVDLLQQYFDEFYPPPTSNSKGSETTNITTSSRKEGPLKDQCHQLD